MTTQAVHWHEGMFLRPHHFQASQRFLLDQGQRNAKWDVHYNWGLRSFDLDLDALQNHQFVVRSLEARFRDGTAVVLPEDGQLAPLDLKPAFQAGSSFIVYLATPALHIGRPNLARQGLDRARFQVETIETADENSGVNPQQIPVRRLNLILLVGDQDPTGYDVLPLAKIERSSRAEALPQIDENFIPPLLACEAWPPLYRDILQAVFERVQKKIDWLANQISTQGITFDSHTPGAALILYQLRELNEAYNSLGALLFTQGLHPLWGFLELSRIVGQLSIFGATRRPPELPRYDHDDLGAAFTHMKRHLDVLLNIFVEPEYKERPFIGAGFRMQVSLEPAWLESSWQMYIGVQSTLEDSVCVNLLTKPGKLDMKVGSSERVDNIFRQGLPGLKFQHAPKPPRALPALPGLVYFQVLRESKDEEWQNVMKSLALALRLNENLIVGNIQNQRQLTVKMGTATTMLEFTLYILPGTSG